MCGIIGYIKAKDVDQNDIELIKNLFLETGIRGQHATGISWIKDDEIHTVKEPVGAAEFVKNFDFNEIVDGGQYQSIKMIGHIRYSTSDLRYNQPFSNDMYAIAHNGVLSQEPSHTWPFKCETENDSEMILHCLTKAGRHPLVTFPESSQAVVYLHINDQKSHFVGGWRNGLRPLYISETFNRTIISSTKNILERCGIDSIRTKMNHEYVYNIVKGDDYYACTSYIIVDAPNQEDLQ
jgi:glutamine phosphoribosylpyrophosphate amidotransferase